MNGAINYQIEATGNPSSYAATNLPMGLSVNSATGLITGTLSALGTYEIDISATNANGTGRATLVIVATPPAAAGAPDLENISGLPLENFSGQPLQNL